MSRARDLVEQMRGVGNSKSVTDANLSNFVEASVRTQRDALIAATDYYALTDVTMGSTVTAYRQALRDVPDQSGFPNTITWPTAP